MDRSRAALARGGDDRVDIQVAFGGRRRTDMDRLVGKMHGETVLVGIAEYGDGAQVELLGRADDPHGDFAAISDQELVEHANTFRSCYSPSRGHSLYLIGPSSLGNAPIFACNAIPAPGTSRQSRDCRPVGVLSINFVAGPVCHLSAGAQAGGRRCSVACSKA
jgi:hypothetical protein